MILRPLRLFHQKKANPPAGSRKKPCDRVDAETSIVSRFLSRFSLKTIPVVSGSDKPSGRSVLAEVYPSLRSRGFAREGRSSDQHDAYSVAAWLRRADLDGSLAGFFKPSLTATEKTKAQIEGWILGIR